VKYRRSNAQRYQEALSAEGERFSQYTRQRLFGEQAVDSGQYEKPKPLPNKTFKPILCNSG
jgi:hypothetical protein